LTVIDKAIKQGAWLALFKFITQCVSWTSTIIVARLLVPEDYGLMDMATLLTGYAALFSELGLGAAVVQRPDSSQEELSSLFWFTCIVSLVFLTICFILAHPTALIFNEPRVIPLTQTVSVIFILNGLAIVPSSLMRKKLNFKNVGFIELTAGLTSCGSMVIIAFYGGGVWTLLLGHIIRSFVKLILIFYIQKWSPKLYFNLSNVRPYINFGIFVSIARTFRYLFERSDIFFAGMFWSAGTLGFYSFAIILAKIPTDKITSLIMQVSYSAFAELQNNKDEFKNIYLNINKIIAMIVLPLFVGGFLAGEELVKIVLDDKWLPIIFLFKMLCISQIFLAISAINNHVHNAQGRPGWNIWYNGSCALIMSVSFYFAVQHGLNAILVPWLTVFPVLCVGFIIATLIKIEIGILEYLRKLSLPAVGTALMAGAVFLSQKIFFVSPYLSAKAWIILGVKMAVGGLSYIGFLFIFDRNFLKKNYRMLLKK